MLISAGDDHDVINLTSYMTSCILATAFLVEKDDSAQKLH